MIFFINLGIKMWVASFHNICYIIAINNGNNMNNTIIQEVFNEKEAANYLRISPKTLQKWRSVGGGPEYRLVGGRRVVYKINDLRSFLDLRIRHNTTHS